MPKPTGPTAGKTTRMWIDRARRSWLLKTRRKTGKQPLPEHRMMMANVWYPARRQPQKQTRHRRIRVRSGPNPHPTVDARSQPWPEDEEAKAMFAAYFARRREDVSPETATIAERYDARLRGASSRRAAQADG